MPGQITGAIGRSERIRTSGPCVPNTVLYQAELHSEADRNDEPAIAGGGKGRKRVARPAKNAWALPKLEIRSSLPSQDPFEPRRRVT
jgi:hypothetical protein